MSWKGTRHYTLAVRDAAGFTNMAIGAFLAGLVVRDIGNHVIIAMGFVVLGVLSVLWHTWRLRREWERLAERQASFLRTGIKTADEIRREMGVAEGGSWTAPGCNG